MSTTRYWRLQIAGWALFGAINAGVARWIVHLPVAVVVGQAVGLGVLGIGLSHLLYVWIRRSEVANRSLLVRVGHVLLFSGVVSLPAGILTSALNLAPWQTADLTVGADHRWLIVPLVHALNWVLLLVVWGAVYLSLRSFREQALGEVREAQLAEALHLAELRLLKAQLNPHFLFNALNTVRALIAEDPSQAQQAVTQLARTLRYTLNSGQDERVSLDRELAIVDDYLAIEALRLGERLSLVRAIDPATRERQIPVMLLQSLVENAIKHGIAQLPRGGVLKISAEVVANALILTVENARPRTAAPDSDSDSIGLRNSTERLRLLFGPQASLNLDVTQADRAVARVRIPGNP
ncbi:MAG: histidine kinase [Proteobacteria bacterium]|nr:histidine kinase [Pseudomonadota bacterium]